MVALLNLSSWCLMMVEWLFLVVPWDCLRLVIVVFPDHTHLLFIKLWPRLHMPFTVGGTLNSNKQTNKQNKKKYHHVLRNNKYRNGLWVNHIES